MLAMPSYQRLSPPFRAEQIGSFARPNALLLKRAAFEQGTCSPDELAQCEDEAIAGIVKFQKAVGMKSITDGEFRRWVVTSLFVRGLWRHSHDYGTYLLVFFW